MEALIKSVHAFRDFVSEHRLDAHGIPELTITLEDEPTRYEFKRAIFTSKEYVEYFIAPNQYLSDDSFTIDGVKITLKVRHPYKTEWK